MAKSSDAPKKSRAAPKKAPKAVAPPEAAAPAPSAPPTPEAIRRRAYELWLENGGSATENWLEAERQLRS